MGDGSGPREPLGQFVDPAALLLVAVPVPWLCLVWLGPFDAGEVCGHVSGGQVPAELAGGGVDVDDVGAHRLVRVLEQLGSVVSGDQRDQLGSFGVHAAFGGPSGEGVAVAGQLC